MHKRLTTIERNCLTASLTIITCLACSGNSDSTAPGSGGDASIGGASAGGVTSTGPMATGGSKAGGGAASVGGAMMTGGAVATGGKAAQGGAPATGGIAATGGKASGGAPATGGMPATATGGMPATATGGMPATATGGMAATGGKATGGMAATGGSKAGTGGAGMGGAATGGKSATGGSTGSGTCAGTAKPCPPTDAGSIAYIGCSMADNIGQGYGQVGGKIMWTNSGYGTGAQVVENWMVGGNAWSIYATKLAAMGGIDKVKAIMVQICVLSTHSDANVRSMITAVRAHVNPGTHIYIVGQPQYEAGHTCSLAGTGGAEWTDTEAQAIAKDSTVNQDLTYLGTFNLDTTKGESSDGCHASASGLTRLGNEAKAFWGN